MFVGSQLPTFYLLERTRISFLQMKGSNEVHRSKRGCLKCRVLSLRCEKTLKFGVLVAVKTGEKQSSKLGTSTVNSVSSKSMCVQCMCSAAEQKYPKG